MDRRARRKRTTWFVVGTSVTAGIVTGTVAAVSASGWNPVQFDGGFSWI